jgi:hypothetical protein
MLRDVVPGALQATPSSCNTSAKPRIVGPDTLNDSAGGSHARTEQAQDQLVPAKKRRLIDFVPDPSWMDRWRRPAASVSCFATCVEKTEMGSAR